MLGHDEQGDPLHAGRCVGKTRENEVHDRLRQVVLAPADPHLVTDHVVRAVGLRMGDTAHVRQRRPGLGLRQAHRAEEPALEHGTHEPLLLLVAPEGAEEVGRARGEQRVRGRRRVGGVEDAHHRLRHHVGQAEAAVLLGKRCGQVAALDEGLQRHADRVDQMHALSIPSRLALVDGRGVALERRFGEAQRGTDHRVEGGARMARETRPCAQALDLGDVVEEELEIAPEGGEQAAHGEGRG